jgi:hypothetical protein
MENCKNTREKIGFGLCVAAGWALFFYCNIYSQLPAWMEAARANAIPR